MGADCCKDIDEEAATLFQDLYDVHEIIGSGSWAVVYKASRIDNDKMVAVKVIDKEHESHFKKNKQEISILENSNHPNIVKYYEKFEGTEKIYLVLELLEGRELLDRIVVNGCYSELQAAKALQQVASAIEYLHAKGIIHRDIKPENLIYESMAEDAILKLTDFGLSAYIDKSINGVLNTPCGTPTYVAPEILLVEPYDESVDIWSIGVLLYIVLCGYPPFTSNVRSILYQQITTGNYEYEEPFWTNVSVSAKFLIDGCLKVNPLQRLGASDIVNHPWIQNPGSRTASDFDEGYHKRLQVYNSKRKLKKTINSIILAIRVKNIIDHTEEKRTRSIRDNSSEENQERVDPMKQYLSDVIVREN